VQVSAPVDAPARIGRHHRQNASHTNKKNRTPCLSACRFFSTDLAQSYLLPYSRFTYTTLFSLLLLLLLPSMPASEPTRLAADVAYVAEVKGFASRLTHVLKMCNHRRAWQRIRQTTDGLMTVGSMRHLVLSQSSLYPGSNSSVAAQPLARAALPPVSWRPPAAALHDIVLHVDELPFAQAASRCYPESVYCKLMFQVF
jgi:hypothetical protein